MLQFQPLIPANDEVSKMEQAFMRDSLESQILMANLSEDGKA